MPETVPNLSAVNFMPSSTAPGSPESRLAVGTVKPVPNIEHGQLTLTLTPAPGVCRLPLSSTARTLMFAVGLPCATQAYVQPVVPVAGCHVVPPSVDTSTPAT